MSKTIALVVMIAPWSKPVIDLIVFSSKEIILLKPTSSGSMINCSPNSSNSLSPILTKIWTLPLFNVVSLAIGTVTLSSVFVEFQNERYLVTPF